MISRDVYWEDYAVKVRLHALKYIKSLNLNLSDAKPKYLYFQHIGSLILSSTKEGSVYFWNKDSRSFEGSIKCHNSQINSIYLKRNLFFTSGR